METPNVNQPAKESLPPFTAEISPERVGGAIGPYRLLEELGEGGFGVVYLAEQRDPIRRTVALKVIKPGMDTKHVVARFAAERQALALLKHPNIARVYDAGTTQTGKPYFVMEYIKGVPITEYCDREKLSIDDRLRLFIQVCEAIQHAHQKGIIHRDIKPSNILVTVCQDKPLPVVIDFGVAKTLGQPLTEQTLMTRMHQLVGTPEYMSPEQAKPKNVDIDTRSDIYSLGVLLYELLTGTLPFDHDILRQAAIDEIQRIIREEEPPRPSTKLSTLGENAIRVAEQRKTNVGTLTKCLHKELEWIPLMAMRKERDRRYKTASDLAKDIGNYLDGKPLMAGPESFAYRLKKLARRHRYASTVLCLVGVILIGNFFVSAYFYRGIQERDERLEGTQRRWQDADRYGKSLEMQVAFLHVLDLWRDGHGQKAEILGRTLFGAGTREAEAQAFLLDARSLPEKQDTFLTILGNLEARSFAEFVVAEHCSRDGDVQQARDFYKAFLAASSVEEDQLLRMRANLSLLNLASVGESGAGFSEGEGLQ